MEKKRSYVKPDIKVVSVVSKQSVANSCWSLDGHTAEGAHPGSHNYSGPFYLDYNGKENRGYLSFWLKSTDGECGAPDAFDIVYYNDGSAADFSETQLEALLTEKGGNNGQPYSNLTTDFPVDPTPMS